MQALDMTKPATAGHGQRASKIEHLGGPLNSRDTTRLEILQARRLQRLFAITGLTASVLAPLVFGEASP